MTVQAKIIGLTVLILALAASVWGMGYLWESLNQNNQEPVRVVQEETKAPPNSSSIKLIIDTTSTLPGRLFIEGQATGL